MQVFGLLNSDGGVFPEYIRGFLMTAFTLVIQLTLMNLSILVTINGHLIYAIAIAIISVNTPMILSKYLVFHEFTHILDADMYANGDSTKYAGLSGYTEYHASQIELMQLLGTKTATDKISFEMNTIISTFSGDKSVAQYIREKQEHAIQLFSRADFPADINTLKSAFGVLYNYWGLRSICEMYASDYVEEVQNDAFLQFIPTINFCLMNIMMHGWLDKQNIEKSIPLYINTLFPLIEKYKLI